MTSRTPESWSAGLARIRSRNAESLPAHILDVALDYSRAEGGGIYSIDEKGFSCLREHNLPQTPDLARAREAAALDQSGLFLRGVIRAPEVSLGVLAWRSRTSSGDTVLLVLRYGATSPDERLLDSLGAMLSLALETASMREERDAEAKQENVLFRVSQAFMSTVELDPLLDLVVSSCVETIANAKNCVLHLLDEAGERLVATRVLFAEGDRRVPRARSSALRPGIGAAGLALSTGSVVNIADATQDTRFFPTGNQRHIGSLLTAPIIFREHPIGTLSVDSSHPNAFDHDDERLLMTLATLAAAAIYNADLFQDLQDSLEHLRDTQAQLIQSEKLSAIGQLIAGITHELNNPLAAISGYAQLLQMTDGLDPQVRQDVTRIHEQAQRAARIVRNLLTFAREHSSMRRPTDINLLLQQTLELQAYQLRIENISVELQLSDDALAVMGDPHQLQQVFFNLISNARDAMTASSGGGRLRVWTERAGHMVHVHIADSGPGLSEETKRHLFEPFYTTKEVGKGTGLGLSICFGIVGEHNGRIWANEESVEGAEFVVALPYTDEVPESSAEDEVDQSPRVTNKLVLLVEDEEPVARVVQRVLNQDGHRVLLGRDGEEALRYLRQAHERGVPFDLVISDIRMPNMGGARLYEEIQTYYPGLEGRVLFITGDSIGSSTHFFLTRKNLPYLMKPFGLGELRTAIDELLI
ncbi:MAG: response regulator [Chloroflexi bacterium]|nr:response regulator [Chloroflexota bacterium]